MQTMEPDQYKKAREDIDHCISQLEKIDESEVKRSKKQKGYLSMSMIHLLELKAESCVQGAEENPEAIMGSVEILQGLINRLIKQFGNNQAAATEVFIRPYLLLANV